MQVGAREGGPLPAERLLCGSQPGGSLRPLPPRGLGRQGVGHGCPLQHSWNPGAPAWLLDEREMGRIAGEQVPGVSPWSPGAGLAGALLSRLQAFPVSLNPSAGASLTDSISPAQTEASGCTRLCLGLTGVVGWEAPPVVDLPGSQFLHDPKLPASR